MVLSDCLLEKTELFSWNSSDACFLQVFIDGGKKVVAMLYKWQMSSSKKEGPAYPDLCFQKIKWLEQFFLKLMGWEKKIIIIIADRKLQRDRVNFWNTSGAESAWRTSLQIVIQIEQQMSNLQVFLFFCNTCTFHRNAQKNWIRTTPQIICAGTFIDCEIHAQ